MKTCNDAPVGYTDALTANPWIGWNGGDCPVHPETTVQYIMDAGDKGTDKAGDLEWNDPTIGDEWVIRVYRVVKEYREPREVWMKEWKMVTFNSGGQFFSGDPQTEHTEWGVCSSDCEGATLFREVIQ